MPTSFNMVCEKVLLAPLDHLGTFVENQLNTKKGCQLNSRSECTWETTN